MGMMRRKILMFDDAYRMADQSADSFSNSVRDAFGDSIVMDILDPILNEINALRVFNESFQQQSFNIDQTLTEARVLQFAIA